MLILPFFDSDTLELLHLYSLDTGMQIEIDEIVKTKQWKEAKKLRCEFCVLNMKAEDICHFSDFIIKTLSISAKDLDFLRKAFTRSSKFRSWLFYLKKSNEIEEVSYLWGPAFISDHLCSWYFRTKDSEEKILLIGINQLAQTVYFENTEMIYVKNGAIVHDYEEN
ncbi:hypothetical protein B9Z55_021281 [Caenorhabditis nigoni]|uniref:DUF38 domain-containing protein n=3 Tax=Caenorhabditis nigoni TaxID=1611254 RepID=A0A2G5TRF6_9PELO|nr:hypothetical protein B9Z55_021281 [Caenorhabditis nigoni]